MICVWLVEAELFLKAEDSLVYFGSRRTDTRYGHSFQGVETPSQCRYVHYYERIKENGGDLPPEKKVHLRKIRMEGDDLNLNASLNVSYSLQRNEANFYTYQNIRLVAYFLM